MKKLFFECNRDQRSALEGLAYRIADTAYMRERFGSDEPELKQNEISTHTSLAGRDTISNFSPAVP